MPKISVHGGPTNAADDAPAELVIDVPAAPEEESSPGNSSETSSPRPEPTQKPSGSSRQSRARKTASPSDKDRTGSSTAPSTDGAPTADGGA